MSAGPRSVLAVSDAVAAGKACRPRDWHLFVREPWEDLEPARAICRRCQVRRECLQLAELLGAQDGVWGGKSGDERRELRGRDLASESVAVSDSTAGEAA